MTTDAKPEPADRPAPTQRPKRRWYQFGLRAMFVWLTVIAVVLAVGQRWIAPARRQQAAVKMVKQVGGWVRYSEPSPHEGRLVTRLRDWLPRDYFDGVRIADLSATAVTDADLQSVGGLTRLEWMYLNNTQVTDAGMASLSGLAQLEILELDNTRITDTGLARLSRLTQLQRLSLNGTQVTELPHLTWPQLRGLSLNDTKVTDAGLANLSGQAQLRVLRLNKTNVTDTGLAQLRGLKELRTLKLNDTRVTKVGVVQLQESLPNCAITH